MSDTSENWFKVWHSMEGWDVLPDFSTKVPLRFARQHSLLAIVCRNGNVHIAMPDRSSMDQADILSRFLEQPLRVIWMERDVIQRTIEETYMARSGTAGELISLIREDGTTEPLSKSSTDLLDSQDKAPVIRLVNEVLFEAIKSSASDIHFQPYEKQLMVRLRIDGVLFDLYEVPQSIQEEVLSRIKVLGKMNIAEKRLPQDGRASVMIGSRPIDLRIASMPTNYGERIVIRLLDKGAREYRLDRIGMDGETLERFRELIRMEHGMILVTGPTGSGKSTTLYSALSELDSRAHNVVTLEDPIEYQLEGISQTQINTKKGMTFASGLRNVLRQDPDIIMLGEIRDEETAEMAVQSALTGHLVFSTLHTNDAASAVARLLDLGIEPYLIASSLLAVLAQRLVRQNCPYCSELVDLSDGEWAEVGHAMSDRSNCKARKGKGCKRCRGSGYLGRQGIYELMVISEPIRRLIQDRTRSTEIRDQAIREGMSLLRNSGLHKVLDGETTVDEVGRVTMRSEL